MSNLKQYVDKKGYKIRATEKAYKLYYEKLGFKPVTVGSAAPAPKTPDTQDNMTVESIKEALNEAGINYPQNAKKAELLRLLNDSLAAKNA